MEEVDIVKDAGHMLETAREVFIEFPKELKAKRRYLEELQSEQQDLLHATEFIRMNAYTGYKLAKDMQELRTERRKIKNEIEVLELITEMVKGSNIHENKINGTLGKVREKQNVLPKRGYKTRVRTDLQEAIDAGQMKVGS